MAEKTCNGNCADEACRIQQRIFEREVDEELRQERLAALWKKYRFLVYGGVIGIILGTIAIEWYGSWQAKIQTAESDLYEKATLLAVADGKNDEALATWENLANNGQTGYRYLAQIQAAGLLLKTGSTAEALSVLQLLAEDTDAPQALRSTARLAYVGHQVDTGSIAELQAYLAPLLDNPENGFYGSAAELSALLSLRDGKPQQAKLLLETALKQPSVEPAVRERLTHLKDRIQK